MKLRYKVIVLFMSMICLLSVITGTYSIFLIIPPVADCRRYDLLLAGGACATA